MKKHLYTLVAFYCIPIFQLSAQLERGLCLLEPGFSFRYAEELLAPAGPVSVPADAYIRTQNLGLGLQFGVMGKKHREWGIAVFEVKSKSRVYSNPRVNPDEGEETNHQAVRAGIYHRKYYPLTQRLWAGYQFSLGVLTFDEQTSYYVVLGDGFAYTITGPLEVNLHGNLFITALLSRRIGARAALGNAGLGCRIHRGRYTEAAEYENKRFVANVGWRPAHLAQFSLFWTMSL